MVLDQSISLVSGVSILISTLVLWIVVRMVAGRSSLIKAFIASLLIEIVEVIKSLFLPSLTSSLSSIMLGGGIKGATGGLFLTPLLTSVLSIVINYLIIMFVFRLSVGQTMMVF